MLSSIMMLIFINPKILMGNLIVSILDFGLQQMVLNHGRWCSFSTNGKKSNDG